MHTGRHRMRTHAGIPHGSTVSAGNKLEFYYQFDTGETGAGWTDRSVNNNNAVQETEGNQPTPLDGGGLDFEDTNDVNSASMMDFTSFNVSGNTDFLMFIVWNPESTTSNTYLSDSTAEVFQQTSGNVCLFKTSSGPNSMNHSSTFTIDTGVKSLFMVMRTGTSTGNITLWKNGLLHDPSDTDATTFDLQNLGSRNDASHWFDGGIFDVGLIAGPAATHKVRDMITDYLCAKHGIARLG